MNYVTKSITAVGLALTVLFPVLLSNCSFGPEVSLKSRDGLVLKLDRKSGAPTVLTAAGANLLAARYDGPSGFIVRDVAAGEDFVPLSGPVVRSKGSLRGEAVDETVGLKLDVRYEQAGELLHVSGRITDLRGADRAVTLSYVLPLAADSTWRWWDHPRSARNLASGVEYKNVLRSPAGARGEISKAPWAVLDNPDAGLTLALAFDELCVFQLLFDGKENSLRLNYDFGLVPEAQKFPSSADFSFYLYRHDPQWGMRSSLARYYEAFPQFFRVYPEDKGIWMPFVDIATVDEPEDFGFGFHEGARNLTFNKANGITSFRYLLPQWHRQRIELGGDNYAKVEKALREDLESADEERRQRAEAALNGGVKGPDGKYYLIIEDQPWHKGGRFVVNCDPELIPADDFASIPAEVRLRSYRELLGEVPETDPDSLPEGIYWDTVEGGRNYLNYERRHFQTVDYPLTFGRDTTRPAILTYFSNIELLRHLHEKLHASGRMTMDNAWGTGRSFMTAPYIDVPGTEMEWITGNRVTDRPGIWGPPADGDLLQMRAFSGNKPYLLLLNARFEFMDAGLTERYFKHSLFYGMFPGFFSFNASADHYFRKPAYYNRDRNLFRRYLPLIEDVAEAGWRPLTVAEVSDPEVLVERYGPSEDQVTYFTLRSISNENRKAYLTVKLDDLGLKDRDLAVWEPDQRREIPYRLERGRVNIDLPITPQAIRTIALGPTSGRINRDLKRALDLILDGRLSLGNMASAGKLEESVARDGALLLSEREKQLSGLLLDPGERIKDGFLNVLHGFAVDLKETERRIVASCGLPETSGFPRRLRQAGVLIGEAGAAALALDIEFEPVPWAVIGQRSNRSLVIVNRGERELFIDSLELLAEAPLTVSLEIPAGRIELAPGDSIRVPVSLSLPVSAAAGRDIGLGILIFGESAGPVVLGSWRWCRARKPVETDFGLTQLDRSGRNFRMLLKFRNRSDEPTYFHFDIRRPEQWNGYPLPGVATMRPGAEQSFGVVIRVPETARPGRYNLEVVMNPDRNLGLDPTALEVVYAPNSGNLLPNPGFENLSGDTLRDWSGSPDSYDLDFLNMHSGRASLLLQREGPGESTVLSQTIVLNQKKPRPIYLRGFGRAEGTSLPGQWMSSVRVNLEYYDGVRRGENLLHFHGRDFDWRLLDGVMVPERAVRRVEVSVVFRESATGRIWYDDLFLTEL